MTDSSVTRWVGAGVVILLALAAWFAWGSLRVDVTPTPALGNEAATTLRQEAEGKPAAAETRVEVKDTTVASDAAAASTVGEVVVTLCWADDDAPVVGHEVIVTDQWTGSSPRRLDGAHTDAGGEATLSLAPGDYYVLALSDLGGRVCARAGERTELALTLPRAGVLVGRVVDLLDAPVPDAEVRGVRGGLAGGEARLATTGADGRFRAHLPTDMFVFARKRGHGASAAVQVRGFANAETGIELVVATAATSVRGRVVDETNQPIAGARVALRAPEPPVRGNAPVVESGVWPDTRAAADGTFTFDDVPPGEGTCFAAAPGWRTGRGEFQAQVGVLAEVRIVLTAGARVVRAQLRTAEGESRDVEASNGFIRVGLRRGTYTIAVDTDGCRGSARFTVDSLTSEELRVDLPVQ